jgi:serine/threonine protein kinase
MDENTQPSTQQVFDPRRLGNQSELCEPDISDIICMLQPRSATALRAVSRTADLRPSHVRQGFGSGAAQDIALRFSSPTIRPSFGFSFGRSRAEADVLISDNSEAAKKISNLHFRIYFNRNTVLMLEDVSQNGTYVDGVFLCGREKGKGKVRHATRVLGNGSYINVPAASLDDEVVFLVQIPSRDGFEKEYNARLEAYLRRTSPDRHASVPAAIPTTSFGMKWDGRPDFKVTNMVGKGAFATVYQLTTYHDGHLVAAKELEKRRLVKDGVLDRRVSNELRIMKSVKHPHIVEYIGSHDHQDHLYILMEYVSGGDLQHYLKRSVLSEKNAKRVAQQTLSALEYLHRHKITHRDIKPDNILIASEDPFTVKLSDFGLSKVRTENSFAKTFCGTILYCAPEVFPQFAAERPGIKRRHGTKSPGYSYGCAVDIWSLGAVLWFALSGSPPFEGMMDPTGRLMFENIMHTPLDPAALDKHGVSHQAKEFLTQMLSTVPENRPTAAECLEHPWIAGERATHALEVIAEEEDQAERFSQLSINDPTRMADSESDWEFDDADLDHMARFDRSWSRSKRVKTDAVFPSNQMRSASDREDSSEEQSAAEPSNDESDDTKPKGSPYLFGELSVSALDNLNALGERANRALTRNFKPKPDHSAIFASSSIPSAIAGATEASLFGAESMVRDLNVASPRGSESYSSVAESSSANSMLIAPEMHDRQTLSYGSEDTPRAKDSVYRNDDDNTPTRPDDRSVPLPDTMYQSSAASHTSVLPAISSRSSGSRAASTTAHQLTPEQAADLAARPAAYGTLRTTRDSAARLLLRLDGLATSWGRASKCTYVYPDNMDRRVPKVSFVLLFHAPGSEAAAARGEDWTALPDLHALVKNCSDSAPLWVNGRLLASKTADGRDCCARLFTGDVLTVFQEREGGECLRFVCEFGVGEASGVRSVPFEAIVSGEDYAGET